MDDSAIRALYRQMLECWNERDAAGMAATTLPDGELVGFDGSELVGRDAIACALAGVFASHPTGRYVAIVRDVREIHEDVAILRAVAGVVAPGSVELEPDTIAVQRLVAVKRGGEWRVASFQNTPAPLASRAVHDELQRRVCV
jgi:uncharacterized protein (TIGR02246 family)